MANKLIAVQLDPLHKESANTTLKQKLAKLLNEGDERLVGLELEIYGSVLYQNNILVATIGNLLVVNDKFPELQKALRNISCFREFSIEN